jgi:dTDP-4-dehydrorhamnose 3,5-epimerase
MKHEIIFSDVINIKPETFTDSRGDFTEIFNKSEFQKIGINDEFLQDNLSFSLEAMTIRGMHFQEEPFAQSKLIKVNKGSVFDVFIDLRKESKNYEEYGSLTLTPADGWIYVPKGFAHGFCTLENSTEVLYKVDNHYNEGSENGVLWNDPFFMIDWPIESFNPILSEKDKKLPKWKEIKSIVKF